MAIKLPHLAKQKGHSENHRGLSQIGLLTQIERFQDRLITVFRLTLEVVEELSAARHEAEKSATGGKIFLVILHVIREMLDPLGHEGDLEVGASGVIVTLLEVSKVDSVILGHCSGNRDGPSRFIAAKPSFDAREIGQDWE